EARLREPLVLIERQSGEGFLRPQVLPRLHDSPDAGLVALRRLHPKAPFRSADHASPEGTLARTDEPRRGKKELRASLDGTRLPPAGLPPPPEESLFRTDIPRRGKDQTLASLRGSCDFPRLLRRRAPLSRQLFARAEKFTSGEFASRSQKLQLPSTGA